MVHFADEIRIGNVEQSEKAHSFVQVFAVTSRDQDDPLAWPDLLFDVYRRLVVTVETDRGCRCHGLFVARAIIIQTANAKITAAQANSCWLAGTWCMSGIQSRLLIFLLLRHTNEHVALVQHHSFIRRLRKTNLFHLELLEDEVPCCFREHAFQRSYNLIDHDFTAHSQTHA